MNKIAKKFAVFFTAVFASALLYMGADWQTEICAINIANHYEPYGWIMCLWTMSNWAAFDFWRLVRYIIVIGWAAGLVYYFTKAVLLENKA